jgi:hypothetical protein
MYKVFGRDNLITSLLETVAIALPSRGSCELSSVVMSGEYQLLQRLPYPADCIPQWGMVGICFTIFLPRGYSHTCFDIHKHSAARNSRRFFIAPLLDSAKAIVMVIATGSRVARCGAMRPWALPLPCHSKTWHLLAELSTWAVCTIIITRPLPAAPGLPRHQGHGHSQIAPKTAALVMP